MSKLRQYLKNKKSRLIIAGISFLLAALLLFIPITYDGFMAYIIQNTIINMNTAQDMLEVQKASVAIYRGANIEMLSSWSLYLLTILGCLFLYLGIAILCVRERLLTTAYWTSFNLKVK